MGINQSWDIRDLVSNIKRLKKEYVFYLAFFLYDYTYEELKTQNNFIRKIKDEIYSLKIEKWQVDKCWEYLNNDINYVELVYLVSRMDKRKKK